MNYFTAPHGWSYGETNPFTPDGAYGREWSCFCILDRDDDEFVTGKSGAGPFGARFGRRVEHLPTRLIDFLRYEHTWGRTVILSFPDDMDVDCYVQEALAHMPAPGTVRADDPPIIVHSTTEDAWIKIRAEGQLKAASELAQPGHTLDTRSQVGHYLANEPPEYPEYIMFGTPASPTPEIILASYQAGRFVLDPNTPYQPGVRLYLDNHRLIRDGRAVRDGIHTIKVHKRLPLAPYLLDAIGVPDVDPAGQVATWTPRTFVERADAAFWQHQDAETG